MKRDPDVYKSIGNQPNLSYLVYLCPRGERCTEQLRGRKVIFSKGQGFQPLQAFEAYLGDGKNDRLIETNWTEYQQTHQHCIE